MAGDSAEPHWLIGLYTDHDSAYEHSVLPALRRAGIDVVTSIELGHQALSDVEQLEFAGTQGRILFTANKADFALLHREWMEAGRTHSGIVVRVPQRFPIGGQVVRLRDICSRLTPETAVNQFIYLGSWRLP